MKELVLIAAAGLSLLLLLWRLWAQRRAILRLREQVDAFLLDGTRTELSTEDSALGHLQTNICELENRLLLEREHTKQESRQNAQFLSDISHQLKTPLAGLRLYCEMEAASGGDSHGEKELALIEKMEDLIQKVLRLEKIRSEAYEMQFADCDLCSIGLALRSELLALFPRKQILVDGTASLRADENWLREALGNLMKNACEHTRPDGTVRLTIAPGERSVSITVEDDGGGVPGAELPRLFDRFHRSSNAAPNSAGIGLAIAKAIIDKHHGTISARNGQKGLAVDLCIPLIDANIKL